MPPKREILNILVGVFAAKSAVKATLQRSAAHRIYPLQLRNLFARDCPYTRTLYFE
jgi:hypothetical protein